ncbi:S8 family serine peptidase [Teredinibacter turnerae]|uniref:S8 family serine peptidase n=1 Tax=Teredinibacter turnerae TaxID=2426 RepID=UPI0003663F8A
MKINNLKRIRATYMLANILIGFFVLLSNNTFSSDNWHGSPLEPRYIVKFKTEGDTPHGKGVLLDTMNTLVTAFGAEVKASYPHLGVVSVSANDQVLARLALDPAIEYVEPDNPRQLFSREALYNIRDIQANLFSDEGMVWQLVCIIDSGYDSSHPDLRDNRAGGYPSWYDGDGAAWYQPSNSHGTHIAGVIASTASPQAGVLSDGHARLRSINVFDETGWAYSSSVVAALYSCVDEDNIMNTSRRMVVNMSFGGRLPTYYEQRAIDWYGKKGLVMVAAAGNDGSNRTSYPAGYDEVIAVTAIDRDRHLAPFAQRNAQVELAAPGVAVTSTALEGAGAVGGFSNGVDFAASRAVDQGVVPLPFILDSAHVNDLSYVEGVFPGTYTQCEIVAGTDHCNDMSGKICFKERSYVNHAGSGSTPQNISQQEWEDVMACINANAAGVVIYSNEANPALQTPLLFDPMGRLNIPVLSMDRFNYRHFTSNFGTEGSIYVELDNHATLSGTSIAAAHVTGAIALLWANHPTCTGGQLRLALGASAFDLGEPGRDASYGYGLIRLSRAMDYIEQQGGCERILEPGVPIEGLSSTKGGELIFWTDLPRNVDYIDVKVIGHDVDNIVIRGNFKYIPVYEKSTHCRRDVPHDENERICRLSGERVKQGKWYISVSAVDDFENIQLVMSYVLRQNPEHYFANKHNYMVPPGDCYNNTGVVYAPIEVDYEGEASDVEVKVRIKHRVPEDIKIALFPPTGEELVLRDGRWSGDAFTPHISDTYEVEFPGLPASGLWQLGVCNDDNHDDGMLDDWSIAFY